MLLLFDQKVIGKYHNLNHELPLIKNFRLLNKKVKQIVPLILTFKV
jgi:hypothetical protein